MLKRFERRFALGTPDKHKIHGLLSYLAPRPKRLVIFVYGLTSFTEEAKFYNGARAFERAGFATVRFDLYGWRPKSRKLSECSVATHAADIRLVVEHFRKAGFKEIFLIGHSLGCPSILMARCPKISGMLFWDGSIEKFLHEPFKKWGARYDRRIKSYILDWGLEYIWGRKMYTENKNIPPYAKLFKECAAPAFLILAGGGMLVKPWRKFLARHPEAAGHIVIPGAGHNFEEGDTQRELLKHSVRWCRRQAGRGGR